MIHRKIAAIFNNSVTLENIKLRDITVMDTLDNGDIKYIIRPSSVDHHYVITVDSFNNRITTFYKVYNLLNYETSKALMA